MGHSKGTRHAPNVGVGTQQNPVDDLVLYNRGWDMMDDMRPNNSTAKCREFSIIPIQQSSEFGPHIFVVTAGKQEFMCPKSIYLTGKVKVVHYQANQNNQDAQLPRSARRRDHVPDRRRWNISSDANIPQVLDVYDAIQVRTNNAPVEGNNPQPPAQNATVYAYPGEHIRGALNENVNYPRRAMVSVCNLFPQSLFRDIIVKVNHKTITQSSNAQYGYKAYVENVLSFGPDALNTHMKSEMWEPTMYWDYNYDQNAGANNPSRATTGGTRFLTHEAWHRRRQMVCTDEYHTFRIRLHCSFSSINRFLPSDTIFQFELIRSDPQFSIIGGIPNAGCEYRIQLADLRLCGKFFSPTEPCERKFPLYTRDLYGYNTARTQILTSIISAQSTAHMFSNIFANAELPQQMYMFMVSSQAYQGSYTLDPFLFNDYNVSNVYLEVEGVKMPVNGLQTDFPNRDTMTAYSHLMENIGVINKNTGISITKEMFDTGYTIFSWDLTPDRCAGDHGNHLSLTGAATLHMQFEHPLREQVQCVVVGVYRDHLFLDETKTPTLVSSIGDVIKAS